MGTPTDYYCDPSIAGDSGAGSIGDPFGDLQYALNNITRDATNGDRINIKAGTDEVLSAALSLATYGTPNIGVPLIFQGYTSAADDGGQGGIDCGSNSLFSATNLTGVLLINIHAHNCGSNNLWVGGADCSAYFCEFNNGSGSVCIQFGSDGLFVGNNVYDFSGVGFKIFNGSSVVSDNYFANSTKDFSSAILYQNCDPSTHVMRNIISVDGSSNGIVVQGNGAVVCRNNSILSAGGTGQGISTNSNDIFSFMCHSNLIEGFSGTGGIGINHATGRQAAFINNNGVYNCATNYTLDGVILRAIGDNESLGASPFAKSGSDTFANRFTYFAPVDTGNVRGGAFVG